MTNIYQDNEENGYHTNELANELEIKENKKDSADQITAIANWVNPETKTTDKMFRNWRQQSGTIAKKVRKATNIDTLSKIVCSEIRKQIEVDRVFIYRFNSDDSGTILVESVAQGWTPAKGETFPAITFGLENKKLYLDAVTIDNIKDVELTPYQLQLLDKYQVKASLILPIFLENEVWGLLGVHNCSTAYQWEEFQISLLERVSLEITQKLRDLEVEEKLVKQAQKQQSLNKIIEKLQRSYNVEQIFKTATQEVRQLLQCERVAIYRFHPDWSGEFIAESVASGWSPLVGPGIKTIWEDTYLQENQGGRYRYHETFIVNDIYKVGHSGCHIEMLEQFEVKAYAIAPVFAGQKLWGLVGAYQNSGPRQWESWEVSFLKQIGINFGLAVSQTEYIEQIQAKSEQLVKTAERQQNVISLTRKIGEALTEKVTDYSQLDLILQTTVAEVRRLLKADRTIVYRFNSDWSGDFIAESLGRGWTPFKEKLINKQIDSDLLQENGHCESIRSLADTYKKKDTYLQDHQGGRYQQKTAFVVNDISQAGFPPCYMDLLEQFEAKAYLTVPIFQSNKLWGLLASYQNSSTREWEDYEVSAMGQIAVLLEVALQQTEYLEQLQIQSQQLTTAATKDKKAKEDLQKGAINLLAAVRPALKGDLTVRAPITEDELGTIADAYNNTLQALRQIVLQVQAAAQQVAENSQHSNGALKGLTNLAQQQSQELNEALHEIQQTVDSTQAVVANAESVQTVVKRTNETVDLGDAAMNRTVRAMGAIRETVAQTSKKIKRLSESSQKISKVVSLISNFATQTNVLALNAAIEATRAGEYGKGFAVVADEVRSLSHQSAAATIEIEKLVQEIQEETGDVAVAMEDGIQQVVEGTTLVSETRQNLNEIVAATGEISNLLQEITDVTQTQMLQSVSATASMKDVALIANKTAAEANNIATVFKQLSEMAQELLASASKFKVN